VKVCDALLPFVSRPVSKLPFVAVAECRVGPLFVQVTLSPAVTVTAAGP